MPGPSPKNPNIRQRANRSSTRATLPAAHARRRVPPLPKIAGRTWHPLTVAFWRDTWQSPMAGEYVQADIHGLYIVAELVDRFWTEPSKELAGEIRLQGSRYGLSPLDRRRLEWQIEKAEAATPDAPKGPPAEDWRQYLSVVG